MNTTSLLDERPGPDFYGAATAIPMTTPWVHHGREPATGLDCLGLMFFLYRRAGTSIDAIDMPYGRRDDQRDRAGLIAQRLERKFVRLPPITPRESRDGDVLLIGHGRDNHVAVVVRGTAMEMVGPHRVAGLRGERPGRLRVTKLNVVWGWVSAVYRHRDLVGRGGR